MSLSCFIKYIKSPYSCDSGEKPQKVEPGAPLNKEDFHIEIHTDKKSDLEVPLLGPIRKKSD